MTDHTGHYWFDPEREAEDLRQYLGRKGRRLLFIEADVLRNRRGSPRVKQRTLAGSLWRRHNPGYRSWVNRTYHKNPHKSSLRKKFLNADVIAIRKHERSTLLFGEENKPLMRLWVLYHETGHALIPGADRAGRDGRGETKLYRECAADAYAALRFLQRFGPEAAGMLSLVSWSRATGAIIEGSYNHLTTTVLDKILADSAHRDFSRLTREQTIALAAQYAKDWAPTPDMITGIREVFSQKPDSFSMLANTCLASPDNFSFYIGAKIFQPFLRPEGVTHNGEAVQIARGDRENFAARFENRAARTRLCDIFSNVAAKSTRSPEPPLATLLRVARRRDRTFIYNTNFP